MSFRLLLSFSSIASPHSKVRSFEANIDSAVHINNMTVHDEPSLPHGGAKKSGWGRFNASAGIEEFLRVKVVTWAD